ARERELQRGVSLVGPHRDELRLRLGELPARGYASQGEAWSFALWLKLAAFELLRADGDDPVLILDDVFSALDTERRGRLADRGAGAEQALVTDAAPADVREGLDGARFEVHEGGVEGLRERSPARGTPVPEWRSRPVDGQPPSTDCGKNAPSLR